MCQYITKLSVLLTLWISMTALQWIPTTTLCHCSLLVMIAPFFFNKNIMFPIGCSWLCFLYSIHTLHLQKYNCENVHEHLQLYHVSNNLLKWQFSRIYRETSNHHSELQIHYLLSFSIIMADLQKSKVYLGGLNTGCSVWSTDSISFRSPHLVFWEIFFMLFNFYFSDAEQQI